MRRERIEELLQLAYREGYADGNLHGSFYDGCRGCYEHKPINDPDAGWKDSLLKNDIDMGELFEEDETDD